MGKNHRAHWDQLYKVIFSNPNIVKDLIINYFNADWVADVDFSTLKKLPTENIGQELDETRSDVIWQVNFKDAKLYIVLLIEFQSTTDKYMAARMLSYIGNLYIDLIRSKQIKTNALLPPVFPLVIYNGDKPWRSSQSFRKLVKCPYPELEKYIPDVYYELFAQNAIEQSIKDPQNLIDLLVKIEFPHSPEEIKELLEKLCVIAKSNKLNFPSKNH